ncbi:hypothetical protein EC988_004345 [Linderina pennispora]|nr:hypothetical protein EC988_004345 [Linderina pennispora]
MKLPSDSGSNNDEYTTDMYTEDDYSDEYTEDSVFSDSNYDESSYTESGSDGETGVPPSTSSQPEVIVSQPEVTVSQAKSASGSYRSANRLSWAQQAVEDAPVFDAHFSSGATSPIPTDASSARAVNALGPTHRFESHTPWGSSTGRLTNGSRKGRVWDDPDTITAANVDSLGGAQFAQQKMPLYDDTANLDIDPGRLTPSASSTKLNAGQPMVHNHHNTPVPQQYQNGGFQSMTAVTAHAAMTQPNVQLMQQQVQLQHHHQQQQLQQQVRQIVNVVPVQQGTKNYQQLQQQIQREQKLQQDAIDNKLLQERAPRIVTIAQFIKSVSRLLSIGFPSATCTEARLTVALIAVLGARTGLDVWFANFNARTVRAVVSYDRRTLVRRLLPEYLAMMLPMAAINQTIKWLISSLTIALRVRLGRYAHERYVDGITNITWNQLHGQGPNGSTPAYDRPDWLLTVQIHRFADMFPRLLADVVKPTFDWFVFSRLLSRFISRSGSLTMVMYVVLANTIIRFASPPVGKNASRLSQLEERYRGVYARISSMIQRAAAASTPLVQQQQQQQQQQQEKGSSIISPEPSPLTTPYANERYAPQAFIPRVQNGFRKRAQEALDGSLGSVASNVVTTNFRRFFGGIGETILAKYGATLTAYYLLSRPLCTPGRRLASDLMHDPAAVMMSYTRNSSYLINLSQATTRLLLMVNDLPKFVWSTVKVDRLLRSLDVHARYRREVAQSSVCDDERSSLTSNE